MRQTLSRFPRSTGRPALLLAAALVFAPAIAHGDWLVTREGSRVATRGAWKISGKLVVFHRPDGTLASLKLADVDLAASREASQAPLPKAPEAALPADRKPVLVLTDADVQHGEPPVAPTEEAAKPGEGEAAGSPAKPPAEPTDVVISDWQRSNPSASDQGVALQGTVTNQGDDVALNVSVDVALYDENGKLVANQEAQLGSRALQPHQSTHFVARFPGVFEFTGAKFHLQRTAIKTKGEEAAPPGNPMAEAEAPPPPR